jgi:IS30 family transposase
MAQHAPLVAVDRAALGTISVHDQPRGPAQWRGGKLSGYGVRSGRVGSSAASKALQAGLPSVPEADSIDLAARQWSPEQIAGWLKRTYPVEPQKQVSHETIYRSLFIQARGVLKKELLEHLRARRTVRRSRHASMKRNGLGQIKNAVSISERPPSVEDRAVPGHWEGDLIGGSRNSYIATLVERHSRYVMLVKVANKDTESVVSALIKQSQRLPGELYRSLTWDRGKELADHQRLTLATEVEIYFCDPRSPWQRGSNENTNRLLRQYLPRGTDLSLHSQAKLSAIARQLNERPRKTLLYQTPAEKFAECVAAIG